MDTLLVEGLFHDPFKYNPEPVFPYSGNNQLRVNHDGNDLVGDDCLSLNDLNEGDIDIARSAGSNPHGDAPESGDFSDACLKYMSEILMEENLEELPSTFEDCCALQACEKELYDVLGVNSPTSSDPSTLQSSSSFESPDAYLNDSPSFESPDDYLNDSPTGSNGNEYVDGTNYFVESSWVLGRGQYEPVSSSSRTNSQLSPSSNSSDGSVNGLSDSPTSILVPEEATNTVDMKWLREAMRQIPELGCHCLPGNEGCMICKEVGTPGDEYKGKRNHQRDYSKDEDVMSSKHIEVDDGEEEIQLEQYDDIMLCREGVEVTSNCVTGSSPLSMITPQQNRNSKAKGRASRSKKKSSKPIEKKEELVDLTTLLTHCAQAVASYDLRSANELLRQIRQHSSPSGNSIQRLAHYFANALHARIDGNGAKLSSRLYNRRVSVSNVLRAYRGLVSAIPFNRTSFFYANLTIVKFAETTNKKKIHIIDFGIFYGFQWPCLIQKLSQRPNGAPELRITGVDNPESGFRPAKAVEGTGRRLAAYCKRFDVPFRYQGIAKKWETLTVEDFKIEEDEVVVVNSLYGQQRLLDETVEAESPRDAYFNLIRKLNPDLFILGIINGAFNAPFFITRFREALFYYSSVYDLFEATMARDNQERMLIEGELYGFAAMNVIACEGAEREERPETYKQWQVRTMKAGFRRVPLDQDLMSKAKEKVKAKYHKDFVLGEDNHWMIQGWKGRILFALSVWKPV
ncbi:Scarecrow-like protein [Drosera capensis]